MPGCLITGAPGLKGNLSGVGSQEPTQAALNLYITVDADLIKLQVQTESNWELSMQSRLPNPDGMDTGSRTA